MAEYSKLYITNNGQALMATDTNRYYIENTVFATVT